MMLEEYDKLMAFTFLFGVDRNWNRKLVEDLNNHFTIGENKYPKNLT